MPAHQKVEVELKPGTPLKPEELRAAIESASQRVRAYELLLCATIEKRDNRHYLRPGELTQRFVAVGSDAARKLEGLAGEQVCVRGKLVATGPPIALEILDVARLPPGEERTPSMK